MKKGLERGLDGRIRLRRGNERGGSVNSRVLVAGLMVALVAVAATGIGVVLAGGDQVQHTHGEDEGYYDVNNNNDFDDDVFPGDSTQNRTGM